MARKRFEGGQANSFDSLQVGESGKVAVDETLKNDESSIGVEGLIKDKYPDLFEEKKSENNFDPEKYRAAIDKPFEGKVVENKEEKYLSTPPLTIADNYKDGIDAAYKNKKPKTVRPTKVDTVVSNPIQESAINIATIEAEKNSTEAEPASAAPEQVKSNEETVRLKAEIKASLEAVKEKRAKNARENKAMQAQEALAQAQAEVAASAEAKRQKDIEIKKAELEQKANSDQSSAISESAPNPESEPNKEYVSVTNAEQPEAKIIDIYEVPKGFFSRSLNWIADKTYRSAYVAFQAERVKSYGGLIKAEFLSNRQLVKREGAIAKHEIADAEVKQIIAGLKGIEDHRNGNQLSPHEARRAEKDSINLNKQLTKAQERRSSALSEVKKHEGLGIVQENKKKHIAENFAHIVGERLSPKKEKYEDLVEKREYIIVEIKTWGELLNSETKKLKELKEVMKTNKFMDTSANKAKVEKAKTDIAHAYNKMNEGKNDISKVDTKMVGYKNILDKWENKKHVYNRYAKERIEPFDQAQKRAPDPSEYRNPMARDKQDSYENEENSPESASPTNSERATGYAENRDSNESAGAFEFDQWADAWNKLYGSKLKIKMEDVMPSDSVKMYRENKTKFNKNQFLVFVQNNLSSKNDKRGGKAFNSNFNLDQVTKVVKLDASTKAGAEKSPQPAGV